MTYFIGVDVGGTKSAGVIVDAGGVTVAQDWREHGETVGSSLPEIVLGSIDRVVHQAQIGRAEIAAYGVAVAGLVSNDQSTLINAAKLGVRHLDLGGELEALLGDRPVIVENDANATLYGHQQRSAPIHPPGTGAASDVVLLLTLGTGTGGAILAGGRPVIGAHGFAAELGHVLVDPDDSRRCLCGAPGCIENYASGRGMSELAQLNPAPTASRKLLGLSLDDELSSREVVTLASLHDPWALDLLELAGHMLGRALTILCTTLDPEEVVIGGSFGHAAQRWLLPAARAEMTARWPFPHERPLPELGVDTIGPFAAAIGAALLSRTFTIEKAP